jgi:frataxin-like iron-binding protein CyaY
MEKAVLTLYTAIGNPARIPAVIQQSFEGVIKGMDTGNGSIVVTLQDDSQIVFNLSHQSDKRDFIASHIGGMANFFAQAETENEELKKNVILQIQCFNCVMGITFGLDDNEERTNFIYGSFYEIAEQLRGFLLYPDMEIYTGQGKLLFSIDGRSELETFSPIANADLFEVERAVVKNRKDMVERATALFAVSIYSEVILSEDGSREKALFYVDKMDELYGVKAMLSPKEQAYLDNPSPEQQECIQYVWRYEACGALLWAAGVVEELSYPSEIIDVPVLAAIFWQHKGIDSLLEKGYARKPEEILDMADRTIRYDWTCVDARIHGKEAPDSLDGGITVERHYAFNWITGANGGAMWDDIQPNT